jgi:hypothetical protein
MRENAKRDGFPAKTSCRATDLGWRAGYNYYFRVMSSKAKTASFYAGQKEGNRGMLHGGGHGGSLQGKRKRTLERQMKRQSKKAKSSTSMPPSKMPKVSVPKPVPVKSNAPRVKKIPVDPSWERDMEEMRYLERMLGIKKKSGIKDECKASYHGLKDHSSVTRLSVIFKIAPSTCCS